MEYEVEGSRPRGRPKKTWKEVVREDCQARKINKEDAMDREDCQARKLNKEDAMERCKWLYAFSSFHETWHVRKENVVALQRAEMRMVRWMCGVKLKDRHLGKELRERLGVDDIALVLQQNRLHWYSHVLRKDDDDWVKKCMEYEVEGSRPRGRPKKTWKEVVCEDCQARKLNKEDAMDCCKWRKVIKEAR